jgi:cytochrome c oxidase subunit 1
MSTLVTAAPAAPDENYLNAREGVWSWMTTLDHKRIGIMYFFGTAASLLLGGIFALLIRIELLTPGHTIVDAGTYNRFFTLHGVIMVWMFMIPSIPTVFGNFLLPIMIGARDVAFPRLNLASFYIYLAGSALTLWALIDGGVDTGWTFYTPYSIQSPTAIIPVATGIVVLGFSTIATGVNFIVTTHTMRAKGMGWMKMPLFVWGIYGTSIIQVLATPVLGMSLIIVMLDRTFHLGLFDPTLGGDPILYQHLFWFYSHPAVYIMVLPAMGVISELVCALARKNPLSYKAIAYSTFGISFVGFLTWGHHMFVAGMSAFDAGMFGILSMLVAIFSAIKVFTWVGTLYRGSIAITTPLVYLFAFLFLFVFGGMTGVAVAGMSIDIHWHDTYFVVAHFHFIMVGGTLTAYLAAIHHWFPKMTGRMYNETWGFLSATMVFAGFFFTFFPQFLLGNGGMPRRYYTYAPEFQMLHVASSAGSSILAAGLVFTLGYLVYALIKGPRADDNPWGARGLEWKTSSPPPHHNFREPLIELPDDYEPYDYYRAERP